MHVPSLFFVALCSCTVSSQGLSTPPCQIGGLDYPVPASLSQSSSIKTAAKNVASLIATAQGNGTVYGTLDPKSLTFLAEVYSLHDTDSLFSYSYTAPELGDPTTGVKTVDANTIFRIGSTSKLWTTYIFLMQNGFLSFDDPITKHVSELASYAKANINSLANDQVDFFDWDHITVGALLSHLGGVPRDAAPGPAQDAKLAAAGLPPVKAQNVSWCGDPNVVQLPCKRADFFTDFLVRAPIASSFRTPIYSNAAFQILGYALESITSKPLTTLFSDTFVKSLNLNATSYGLPVSNKSVYIPINSSISWYDTNLVDETPAGGYYSSLNDMKKVGRSILNSTFLTPTQTRRWLKPDAFVNPTAAVGSPWEIFLANNSLWMYTKSGDLGLYSSFFAVIPEYNVGFNLIGAGKTTHTSLATITSIIAAEFVPALEAAAKESANTKYSGTYTDKASNSSITITTTATDPGLVVTDFTAAGLPVLSLLGSIEGLAPSQKMAMHLYPTGLTAETKTNMTESWRAVYEALPSPTVQGLFGCQSWQQVDLLTYGKYAMDEFRFVTSTDGKTVIGIEAMVLGLGMQKNDASTLKEKRGFVRMVKEW